jgi:L-arabinose isomerase
MRLQDQILTYTQTARAKKAKIGVFAIGHYLYWPQFPALKDKLTRHYRYFADQLAAETGEEIIACPLMSDCYATAAEVADYFAAHNLDMIICFVATYSPAVCAVTVLNRVPAKSIMVCLQPSEGMDYARATTEMQLENDNITSVPEIISALRRGNRSPLDCVVGALYGDDRAWGKLRLWCQVAHVAHHLKFAHLGYMGQGYEGMLDMNSDPTMFDNTFGMHVQHIEIDNLDQLIRETTDEEFAVKQKVILDLFEMPDPGSDPIATKAEVKDLDWPVRVAVGMDKLILKYKLDGLAYHYRGLGGNRNEMIHAGMIIGNSLLTGMGIAIAGELDLKNCLAMLIMDRFGAGGSFAELHPIDLAEDFVLVGHDGPHHIQIADGKPVLRNLSVLHGKRGYGPSVEFNLKVGPISMLGVTQTHDGRFKFVFAEGESLPGLIPATGNTNTRGRFQPDIRTFLERWSMEGPTHHFALGLGHISGKVERLAQMLDIEYVKVTP